MKRVIKNSENIFGMANPKKFVLDKLYSFTNQLSDHIIKCVVYQNSLTTDPEHWIHEIAVWLNASNKLRCKSKMNWEDYQDTLFAAFGDELSDAEWQLEDFKRRKCKRSLGQYPDFEIDSTLITDLFTTYQKILNLSEPWLVSQQVHSVNEWKKELESILL